MDTLDTRMEKLRALEACNGVQNLLNEAIKVLGNPILFHDMEYKAVAYTQNIVTDDPIWQEFAATGTVSLERLEFYKNEDFLDTAANAKKITVLSSDKLKYNRIYGKVFNCDNIQVGCTVIVETCRPFIEEDLVLYEAFCDVFNKEVAKSEFFRDYGQQYQESLIAVLIDGDIDDKELYTAHLESVYINLKSNLFLAVAKTAAGDSDYEQLKQYRDMLKKAEPGFKYAIYKDTIVVIISSDDTALRAESDLGRLDNLFGQHCLYAGVSSCFDNLFQLQHYYQEALEALDAGLQGNKSQQIFLANAGL